MQLVQLAQQVFWGQMGPDAVKSNLILRFYAFCRQCAAAGELPPAWDWPAFLAAAAPRLAAPLDKAGAKELWGGENIFVGALSGRSLRFTATQVYGVDYTGRFEDTRPEFQALWRDMKPCAPALLKLMGAPREALGEAVTPKERDARMFDAVGGAAAWAGFWGRVGDPAAEMGLKVRAQRRRPRLCCVRGRSHACDAGHTHGQPAAARRARSLPLLSPAPTNAASPVRRLRLLPPNPPG